MNKSLVAGLAAALTLSLAYTAPAAHAEDAKQTPNAYTQCGIGAAIFNNNGAAAAISNVIWDWGTTALSSATMSPEQCSGSKAHVAMLVGTSYAGLETDLASGHGQYLAALADMMKCDANSRNSLFATVRNDFAKEASKPEFLDMDKVQKGEKLYMVVESVVSKDYSTKCTAI